MSLFALCSCGNAPQTYSAGSLAFSVIWHGAPMATNAKSNAPNSKLFTAGQLDCAASGISVVQASVYDASNTLIATGGPWNCTEHSGTINNIPAQSNLKNVVLGKDSSGNVLYRGEEAGISIVSGRTTNAGAIEATVFSPLPITPTDGALITNDSFSFTWTGSGASYQIQVSNTSGFSSPVIDQSMTTTSYSPDSALSAGTYYWRVKSLDSYGNASAWSAVSSFTVLNAPSAPSGVSVTAGNGQATIIWTAPTGTVSSYTVYYSSTSPVNTASPTKVTNISGTSTTITGLTNGNNYYFIVTATSAGGESTPSSQVMAMPQIPAPSQPTGLSATPADKQVSLSWQASSGATSYQLYFQTNPGASKTSPNSTAITGTSTTITGLANGTTYYFIVTAVNAGGESPASLQVSALPQIPAPGMPTSVAATGGNGQAAIVWTAPTGTVSSYTVYYSTTNPVTTASLTKATGLTGTSKTIAGLTNGTTYYFVVTATNAGGESPASSQVSALPQIPAPGQPTGVSATGGNGQATIAWTAPTGTVSSYTVYYSTTNPVTTASLTKATGLTGNSKTITGLTNGATYYFIVTAVNPGGESPASSQVSALPQIPAPGQPTGVSATGGSAQATIGWTAPAGLVSSYTVYYSDTNPVTTSSPAKVSAITGTATTISGLTNGTTYYFVVTATNAGGESLASSQVSALPQIPAPGQPTGVSATADAGQATISWTAPGGTVSSYTVYYSVTNPVTKASPTKVTAITGASATISGLTNGTTYYFIVTAVNAGGESPASAQVSARPQIPVPGQPTGVSATGGAPSGNPQVYINWIASAGTVSSYTVYFSTANPVTTASPTKLTGITGTSAVITGLVNWTTYYFIVTAANAGGESVASAQVSADPPGGTPRPPATVAVAAGNQQNTLTWIRDSLDPESTGFNIYWSNSAESANKGYGNKISNVTSPYTHTNLSNGTTYYYVVTSTNFYYESIESSMVYMAPGPPAAPTAVTAVRGVSQVTLSWNSMYGATSYNVYGSLTAGVRGVKIATIASTVQPSLQYTQGGLADGTTYYYVVTAESGGGESADSTQVSATTVQRRLVPDTGQILCSNATGTIIDCLGQGQDGTRNANAPSYRDNGDETISDLVTGLLWQKQGSGTKVTWDAAKESCVSANLAQLGGHSAGWRLPTDFELLGLIDFSTMSLDNGVGAADVKFDAQPDGYWSSTTVAGQPGYGWTVWFGGNNGVSMASYVTASTDAYYARCVYGTPTIPSFTDNQDGTVTDNVSSLQWQKQIDGVLRDWDEAINYCSTYGGNTAGEWRLPNIKELASIEDKSKSWPAMDTTYFPNPGNPDYPYYPYMSSTSSATDYSTLWFVYVPGGGERYLGPKTGGGWAYWVRCVRGW